MCLCCLFYALGLFFVGVFLHICVKDTLKKKKKQGCSSQEGVHHATAITATYADGKDSAQTEGGYFV